MTGGRVYVTEGPTLVDGQLTQTSFVKYRVRACTRASEQIRRTRTYLANFRMADQPLIELQAHSGLQTTPLITPVQLGSPHDASEF